MKGVNIFTVSIMFLKTNTHSTSVLKGIRMYVCLLTYMPFSTYSHPHLGMYEIKLRVHLVNDQRFETGNSQNKKCPNSIFNANSVILFSFVFAVLWPSKNLGPAIKLWSTL